MVEIKGNPADIARTFIAWLSEKHPVAKDVVYVFEEKEYIRYGGTNNKGVAYYNETGPAKIRIANVITQKKYGLFFHLRTLAHEYRHILQRYRDNLTYRGGHDQALEIDAIEFANKEVYAALEAGIVDVTHY
ncbi:hypothetical protein [Geomonas ferrireducens]|uniref:hypothetical protein n=1 Tax=Geomonas ferrireducens TaxID=2570227 RepID=UPI0010A79046|nr:hypothetical protein [Geomonas ferrireducens]